MEVLNNHSLYIPVIFYVFWFMISAILSNSLTSGDSLTGYFSKDNKYMSKRNVMPR